MDSVITSPRVSGLIQKLYADAAHQDPLAFQAVEKAGVAGRSGDFFAAMRGAYLAVSPEFGNLLYTLTRASRAKTVVEFGTSMGVSTIFMAAALRDNGGGKLITTEFHPEKVERAKQNLAEARLLDHVEFRVGDALQTLKAHPPRDIDLLMLDGPKDMYLDVLNLVEANLRPGAIVASDNTDHSGLENFLQYVRTPSRGYFSSAIVTNRANGQSGHEVTIRV
jgi:predicted O-methyltransferase YrrM